MGWFKRLFGTQDDSVPPRNVQESDSTYGLPTLEADRFWRVEKYNGYVWDYTVKIVEKRGVRETVVAYENFDGELNKKNIAKVAKIVYDNMQARDAKKIAESKYLGDYSSSEIGDK